MPNSYKHLSEQIIRQQKSLQEEVEQKRNVEQTEAKAAGGSRAPHSKGAYATWLPSQWLLNGRGDFAQDIRPGPLKFKTQW